MLGKLFFSTLLTVSLSCFGQVVSTGGYATTSGPAVSSTPVSAANAPLVATPDVALPGSGPAVGTPLGSANSNDSRVSTGPSVYNPNFSGSQAAENAATSSVAPATTGAAGAQSFEFGVQTVNSNLGEANSAPLSLGEIARNLRAHRRAAAKVLNNDSIARLNASGMRTGLESLPDNGETVASAAQPAATPAAPAQGTLMAENQTPALPQSDQNEAAEAAQPASSQNSTTAQQRHPAPPEPAASPDANAAPEAIAKPTAQASADQNSNRPSLPQTASPLPLILLIGGLGVAGGLLYLLRR